MKRQILSTLSFGAMLTTLAAFNAVDAKERQTNVWTVTRTSDPLTDEASCVVTAYDTVRKMKFSRFGFLYPVVENNSRHGLLIGVSSGGQYRVPTGDILWRVDSNPHRTLRAADNPVSADPSPYAFQAPPTGDSDIDRRIANSMEAAQKMTTALTATSTMASGELAAEMLAELAVGKTLIYRQQQVAPAYGLPSSQTNRVGQYTSDQGQVPFRLDASFYSGLKACGIEIPKTENSNSERQPFPPATTLKPGPDGTIHVKSEKPLETDEPTE